ncbi:MAG: hypothetical protein IJU23_10255 [Proteobacteria bacterium]|nr:hypothetical protein [Pseudomonadota bacterium]
MQKALESIFGPELLGIFSLLLMVVMVGPKFVTWWRGFRSRQKGPTDGRRRITGQRHIRISPNPNVSELPDHPDHGKPLMVFKANLRNLFIEAALWILPLPAVYFLIPEGQHSARLMFLLITFIMACIGLFGLMRTGDRAVFYETGMELQLRFKHSSVDYNSICRITERKSMFFWMNASYILHLDDDTLIVLDGSLFKDGATFKSAFKSLDARVKHNTSLIQPEKQEVAEKAPEAVPEQAPEAEPEQAPDVDTAKASVESVEKS